MGLGAIALVTVPVTDQDRATSFYVNLLGFEERFDYVMDAEQAGSAGAGARWVMLTPPGGGVDITLSNWTTPPGTGSLSIECDDADGTYAELQARGVESASEPQDAQWGRWFGLDDPDGNSWLVVQPKVM